MANPRHRPPPVTVRDLGEFGLIRRVIARAVRPPGPARCRAVVGIGDDCAVLPAADPRRWWLCTCDPVVEGVHYAPDAPPRWVGWKAMARNLSDIAAMGGQPRWAVVSLGLRPATPVRWVRDLYRGLQAAADRFGCAIVGGDTTHVRREPFVVVTVIGDVERDRLVLRGGARPGDAVLVTGRLGGAHRGKHLRFTPRLREARWLAARFRPRAMIDLSDGLASDLQRLVEAAPGRIGFAIDAAAVPIARAARGRLAAALGDGEDFELLFTIDPRRVPALRRQWARAFALELTVIGRVTRTPGRLDLVDPNGRPEPLTARGYDHFAGKVRRAVWRASLPASRS